MQLKFSVFPLLALISLTAASPQYLGYGEGYSNSLDTGVQQGADPTIIFDTDITEQDAGLGRHRWGPVAIVPMKSADKCLDVRGANFQNGTPVQIYDCNGTRAQKWVIHRHSGHIRVSGTNFCLDATGESPPTGTKLRIWTCSHPYTSHWVWTPGNGTIKLRDANKCVDLSGGSLDNERQTQVWPCNGNQNQIWGLRM